MDNKIGRNDLCGCGSGKKYKKCCLIAQVQKDVADDIEWNEWFAKDIELGKERLKDSQLGA